MIKLFKKLTVKKRLLVIILLTSTISVFMAALTLSYSHYKSVKKQLADDLNVTADLLIDNLSAALAFDDIERARGVLMTLQDKQSVLSACLYSDSGQVVVDYKAEMHRGECPDNVETGQHIIGHRYINVTKNITEGDVNLGRIYLEADLKRLADFLQTQSILAVLTILSIIGAIAFPLANLLQKSITEPVYDLVDKTRELPAPVMETNMPALKEFDEFDLIANALSASLNKLEATEKQLKETNNRQLALILNKFLTMRYMTHEAKLNNLAASVFRDFLKEAPYGSIQPEYISILHENQNLSENLEKHALVMSKNIELEAEILNQGRQQTNILEAVNTGFANVFYDNDPSYLNITESEHFLEFGAYPELYKEAIVKMAENIFLLLDDVRVERENYDLKINVEYNENVTITTFSCSAREATDKKELFDFNGEDIELKLFNCKFFHNINSPRDNSSFSIDIMDSLMMISSVISEI